MQLKRITWLILLILIKSSAFAQDTVMIISPALYEDKGEIYPAKLHGWYFKQGSDTAWAAKNLDMTGWKKMRPVDLSIDLADANGKVEGWFRGTIKIDSSFGETQLSLLFGSWAAQDIYIDGKKFASSGNTGSNGSPAEENKRVSFDFFSLSALKPGSQHTIAWHILDGRALPFNSKNLKSAEIFGLQKLMEIGSARTIQYVTEVLPLFGQVVFGVILSLLILMALLWLLWILNKDEKNILHFALFTTFLDLNLILNNIRGFQFFSFPISYVTSYWLAVCASLFFNAAIGYIIYLLALIFKHPLRKWVALVAMISIILNFCNQIFLSNQKLEISILIINLLISISVILSSLRKVKGANWAVIAGIFLTIVSWLLNDLFIDDLKIATLSAVTGFLSFPLSFIVYVAIRFREMFRDIRANAEQVIKLSDEKRMQAEHQQELLEQEVIKQTVELRNSLEHLKATQGQLIQSEKMASLGELTAGIAHEIQNPLNFVNNFSELNNELIEEMKAELVTGNLQQATEIADNIKQNLEKINHHGKRADAIVKGMLQHSRSSSGVKEPTGINALADEYLRLAYHGLRAKDKSFNAIMQTDFDESIGKVNVITQDLGRVILNLITNAFYAVTDKKKKGVENYEPTVWVSTKKAGDKVMIKVRDNGMGIPQNVREKIFQPFFTTKPTGEGTGLGLSMSYDIITKGHGGEISVTTEQGEYTEFSILLPV